MLHPKWRFRCLARRKQAGSDPVAAEHRLARELSVPHLVAMGVGSTIGAGVYVLVGAVAREQAGPSITISFLIAGIAAALSAFCYAELASRCPSAGSAYNYSYIFIGEGVAWFIGWALILEYTIGGATVARGISPNLALFFGGLDKLPSFLARVYIPGLDLFVDPCAAILVLIVTGLLCLGIKESSLVQTLVTCANVMVMLFVILAGGYLGFRTGWIGYTLSAGYFPYGVNGMLAGSATLFFAYIGFDIIATTAEEVKNPQSDLPWGIGLAFILCCFLYMMVSVVVVGLVPYLGMDPDTPISTAFAENGMQWAVYVISSGAVLSLCSSLIGGILPQPRILMAMARDGLLPSFFSDVNRCTQVPVNSTILTGISAAALAFFMDVSELAGMVSVGTLLAFTAVAISILVLRYIPPKGSLSLHSGIGGQGGVYSGYLSVTDSGNTQDNVCHNTYAEIRCLGEVPLQLPRQGSPESVSLHSVLYGQDGDCSCSPVGSDNQNSHDNVPDNNDAETAEPLIATKGFGSTDGIIEEERRKKAAFNIAFVCLGVLILASSASSSFLPVYMQYFACSVGGLLLLSSAVILLCTDQDDSYLAFGQAGGFLCPFVPLLPISCILINVYLLINLGYGTWIRVSVWLVIGVFVYVFYGQKHSSLAK